MTTEHRPHDTTARKPMNIHLESMAGEMLADISALDVALLAEFVCDDDDFDTSAFAENRNCINNSAGRCAAAVPANHHIVDFERPFLDAGHHNHRAAGLKQCSFADDLIHRAHFGLTLANDGVMLSASLNGAGDRLLARATRLLVMVLGCSAKTAPDAHRRIHDSRS